MSSTVKEMQVALQAAEREADRVAALIAERAPTDEAPAVEAERARMAYEDAAAAVALGDAPAESAAAARKTLQTTEQRAADVAAQHRQAEALRAGLLRRQQAATEALESARARLRAAHIDWAQAELQTADEAYTTAALAVGPAVARIAALRDLLRGLGVPTAGPGIVADSVKLEAIGPASARAAMAATPGAPHGWNAPLFRIDSQAARQALAAELADIATPPAAVVKAAFRRALGAE